MTIEGKLLIDILKYFFSALILSVLNVPLTAKASRMIGYIDRPQGDVLKIHEKPVPHSGRGIKEEFKRIVPVYEPQF